MVEYEVIRHRQREFEAQAAQYRLAREAVAGVRPAGVLRRLAMSVRHARPVAPRAAALREC